MRSEDKIYSGTIQVEELDYSVPFFLDPTKPTPIVVDSVLLRGNSPEEIIEKLAEKFGLSVEIHKPNNECGAV